MRGDSSNMGKRLNIMISEVDDDSFGVEVERRGDGVRVVREGQSRFGILLHFLICQEIVHSRR